MGTRAAWMSGAQVVNHPDKSSQSSTLLRPPRRIWPGGLSRTARGRFRTGPQPCFSQSGLSCVTAVLCVSLCVMCVPACHSCKLGRDCLSCVFRLSGLGLNRAERGNAAHFGLCSSGRRWQRGEKMGRRTWC